MAYKLGKLPAHPEDHPLKLENYIKTSKLPDPPAAFGWDHTVASFPLLLNDRIGDCAIAGSLHEQQLFSISGAKTLHISDHCAIQNYHDVTGYIPGPELVDPTNAPPNPTDQGTDVVDLMRYRYTTGLVDDDGQRHKIVPLALKTGDLKQLAAGLWIFGAAGLGFQLPAFAQDDFAQGKPWDVQTANSNIEGGHYIAFVGKGDDWRGATWGGIAPITDAFVSKFCDEAWVGLSLESLNNGINLDGFNQAQLEDDLKQLGHL